MRPMPSRYLRGIEETPHPPQHREVLRRVLRASPLLFASVRIFGLIQLLFWNRGDRQPGLRQRGLAIIVNACVVTWRAYCGRPWQAVQWMRTPPRSPVRRAD
jgi:hypothetical protein